MSRSVRLCSVPLLLGFTLVGCESEPPPAAAPPEAVPPSTAPASGVPTDLAQLGFDEGPTTADLYVVEFSDFACGYCQKFHVEVYPELTREFIQPGRIAWKYVPFILGIFPNAEEAAHVGLCVGKQGLFPEIRDELFNTQDQWKPLSDPKPLLRAAAESVGADLAAMDVCIAKPATTREIQENTQLGFQLGIRGTPTFFLLGHGAIPGHLPLDLFRGVLQDALAKSPGSGTR